MISGLIACDVYRIEPVDPYSDDYAKPSVATSRNRGQCPTHHRELARVRSEMTGLSTPARDARARSFPSQRNSTSHDDSAHGPAASVCCATAVT
jgi:hypothetical protein